MLTSSPNPLRIYLRHIRLHILSQLEYRGWWLMGLQTLVVAATEVLAAFLLSARFGAVGEWTLERMVLVYALAVTAFGIAESFYRGFDYFPWRMIRSGGFDRLLLRPCSLTVQVAASFFHLHRLPRVALGLGLIFWALSRMGVALTLPRVLLLVITLLGGAALYCGVFVLCAGIAFFTVKALDWMYILQNASYQVTRCPVPHLPGTLRAVFTFVMPMLLVSYYPASALCGWGEPLWTGLLALPAGVAFYVAAMGIWRVGVRHYKSTGS
jgi:ABC-2 type transport system permease protein